MSILSINTEMPAVTLFSLPQVVNLTYFEGNVGAPTMNFSTSRSDFKVFQNVQNEIVLFVKDIDEQNVDLTSLTIVLNMTTMDGTTLVYQKTATNSADPTIGVCTIIIPATDSMNLPLGPLRYNVTCTRQDTTVVMLYQDKYYQNGSTLQVLPGPIPQPVSGIIIQGSDLTPQANVIPNPIENQTMPMAASVSSSLAGPAQVGHAGNCTAAIYCTDFSGSVYVQATLNAQPSQDDLSWVTVVTENYTNASGIQAVSFSGMYMWVRFIVQTSFGTTGTVDQIIFKN